LIYRGNEFVGKTNKNTQVDLNISICIIRCTTY